MSLDLDAIEVRAADTLEGPTYIRALRADALALVAEVRRLHEELARRWCTACAMDDRDHCEHSEDTPCYSERVR